MKFLIEKNPSISDVNIFNFFIGNNLVTAAKYFLEIKINLGRNDKIINKKK
jgi:hypothetical protein